MSTNFAYPTLRSPQPPAGPYGYNPYPYGGFDPNADNGTGNGPDTSQNPPGTNDPTFSGNEADVSPNAPMEDIYATNRDTLNTTGNELGQQAGSAGRYYGGIQTNYQDAQDTALNDLQQTPGYTGSESTAIQGDPTAPLTTAQGNLGAYQSNLGGQVGNLDTWLGDAQGKFTGLDSAVSNPNLAFDPNGTEKQMTDQDVNDITTAAGTTLGNRYQSAEDTLERQAAASGNSSPAALAAARQQLLTQEGSEAGDAMTNARIAALQAQQTRAQGIEQQREGATQTQAGLQATAATTEEAAAQAAAGTAGQAGINAANQYGQFNTTTQAGLGTAADQAESARATGIANQRIAGQGAYRSGVAGQQTAAEQGAETATNQQNTTYGTQTAGANAAATGQSGFEVQKASLGDKLGTSLATLFAKGGVAEEPTMAKVGEHGPEAIVNIGRYFKSMRKPAMGMAA